MRLLTRRQKALRRAMRIKERRKHKQQRAPKTWITVADFAGAFRTYEVPSIAVEITFAEPAKPSCSHPSRTEL